MKKHKVLRIITIPMYINLILRGQMEYLNRYFVLCGVSADDGFHFQQITPREGIRMITIPFKRIINGFNDAICLLQLIGMIVREKPSIVHTETPKAGLLGMLAAKICGVPIRIHSIVGIPLGQLEGGFKGKLLGWMEEITMRCATVVVPNSESLNCELAQLTYLTINKKLHFFGHGSTNGISLQRFSPNLEQRALMRSQWNIGKDRLVLGYVGRIARDKGSRELLDAFKRLKPKYPQLVLLMVGLFEKEYGELSAGFEEELKQTEGVVLAGRQPEVVPYFQMMDILVHPTYREGLPNALLEASAMELPIVSTDIPGCNEVVAHGVTGLLVAPKDVDALEVAIEELVVDAGKRTLFGKAGRVRVSERYEQRKVWDYWKQLYEQSLDTVR